MYPWTKFIPDIRIPAWNHTCRFVIWLCILNIVERVFLWPEILIIFVSLTRIFEDPNISLFSSVIHHFWPLSFNPLKWRMTIYFLIHIFKSLILNFKKSNKRKKYMTTGTAIRNRNRPVLLTWIQKYQLQNYLSTYK